MESRFAVYRSSLNGKGIHIRIALEYRTGNQSLERKRGLVHPFIRTVIERISHFQHFYVLLRIRICPSVFIADGRSGITEKLCRKCELVQYHTCSDDIRAPSVASILLGFKFLRIIGFAVRTDNIHRDIEISLISRYPPHNRLYVGRVGILPIRIAYIAVRPVLIGVLVLLARKGTVTECLKCTEPWVISRMDHLTHQIKIRLVCKNARMGKNHTHTLAPVFRGSMRGYLLLLNLRKPVPVNNGIVRGVFIRWLGMYFYPPGLHETASATARMTVSRRLHAA